MLAGLAPDGGAAAGKLTVTIRKSGGSCGGNCPNGATNFQVYAANDAWNEGDGGGYSGAEWTNRVGNTAGSQIPWELPGAKGPTDRSSVLLGTAVVSANQATTAGPLDVVLTIDASTSAEIGKWLAGGNLSLLLAPSSGGTLFLYSREGMVGASQFSLTVCK